MESIQILLHVLFFVLGITFTYIFFKEGMYVRLKSKYDNLTKEKTPINQSKYDQLSTKYNEIEKEKETLENNIDKLKKYIGLVDNNEYGIITKGLSYSESPKGFEMEAEFRTIQRGKDKVKISINKNTIKTSPNQGSSEKRLTSIKNYVDGWYSIDTEEISWVVPDEVIKREVNIDIILGELD